jgi:glycosyltransferase
VKISLITAVRNKRDTIGDAIESVQAQTWPNVEHIVIDGASSDGTLDVLNHYVDRLAVVVSERDEGIYDALNKGIRLATGEVVGFLHSDDMFASDRALETVAAAFADPTVDAVYGDLAYVSSSDATNVVRFWKAGEFTPTKLAWGWMPPHPTFYVRRSVYARLGAFDTSYRIAADYECMLRFLGEGRVAAKYVPEVLVNMRLGGASNRSMGNILKKSAEDYRALRENDIGAAGALLWKNLSKLPQFVLRS